MLTPPLNPDDFRWPYSGMLHDIRTAIDASLNILAALGLLVFTEIVGRDVLIGRRKRIRSEEAFRVFFEEYMDQPPKTGKRVWGAFRGGLVHRFEFEKAANGIVYMRPPADEFPVDEVTPVIVSEDGKFKALNVNAYWRDWQRGLAKWASERSELMLQQGREEKP